MKPEFDHHDYLVKSGNWMFLSHLTDTHKSPWVFIPTTRPFSFRYAVFIQVQLDKGSWHVSLPCSNCDKKQIVKSKETGCTKAYKCLVCSSSGQKTNTQTPVYTPKVRIGTDTDEQIKQYTSKSGLGAQEAIHNLIRIGLKHV